jgi:hypothetical protein
MSAVRGAVRALLAVAVAGNAIAMLRNRSRFPFCAYNMFFGTVPDEYPQLRVRLLWERPRGAGRIEDTRGLLPFEFFRTVSILEHTFLRDQPEPIRRTLAETICDGLNHRPWSARDEVCASLRSDGEPLVVGFDLLLMRTSAAAPWQSQLDEADRFELVYAHRMTDPHQSGSLA